MEDRRSAFESFFEYIGADEYIKSSPAVAEFLGVTPVEPPSPSKAAEAAPPAPVRAPSPPKPKPAPPVAPPVVEKPTWKSHPFEDALSALDVSDKPQAPAAPKPAAAKPAAAAAPAPAARPAAASASASASPGGFQPFSSFGLSAGPGASGAAQAPAADYPKTSVGLREAVKSRDTAAVKELLAAGCDPRFIDSQGMSLLHVAAMFNATDIALLLMDAGADPEIRNGQDESVFDVAPVMLAAELRKRMAARAAGGR